MIHYFQTNNKSLASIPRDAPYVESFTLHKIPDSLEHQVYLSDVLNHFDNQSEAIKYLQSIYDVCLPETKLFINYIDLRSTISLFKDGYLTEKELSEELYVEGYKRYWSIPEIQDMLKHTKFDILSIDIDNGQVLMEVIKN